MWSATFIRQCAVVLEDLVSPRNSSYTATLLREYLREGLSLEDIAEGLVSIVQREIALNPRVKEVVFAPGRFILRRNCLTRKIRVIILDRTLTAGLAYREGTQDAACDLESVLASRLSIKRESERKAALARRTVVVDFARLARSSNKKAHHQHGWRAR